MPYIEELEPPEEKEAKEFIAECEEKSYVWRKKFGKEKAKEKLKEFLSSSEKVKSFKFGVKIYDREDIFREKKTGIVKVKFTSGVEGTIFYEQPPSSQWDIVFRLQEKLADKYVKLLKKYGREVAKKKIIEIIKKEPWFKDYVIKGDKIYVLHKNGVSFRIYRVRYSPSLDGVRPSPPVTEEERKKRRLRRAKKTWEEIVRYMKKGWMIIFTPGGGSRIINPISGRKILRGIERIMSSGNCFSSKRKQLENLIKDPDVVKEILKNYEVGSYQEREEEQDEKK
jgi:hypothetical protein